MMKRILPLVFLAIAGVADCAAESTIGMVVRKDGVVELSTDGGAHWKAVEDTLHPITEGSVLRTGKDSSASILLDNDSVLQLQAGSEIRFAKQNGAEKQASVFTGLWDWLTGKFNGNVKNISTYVGAIRPAVPILENDSLAAGDSEALETGIRRLGENRSGDDPFRKVLIGMLYEKFRQYERADSWYRSAENSAGESTDTSELATALRNNLYLRFSSGESEENFF